MPLLKEIVNFYGTYEIEDAKDKLEACYLYKKHCSNPVEFSLLCTVAAIGLARKSEGGTDYCRTLKLIDSSTPSAPLSIVFFADPEDLPHVLSVGDTISIENAKLSYHNGDISGMVKLPGASYMLFHGNNINQIYHRTNDRGPDHADEMLATLTLENQLSSGLEIYQLKIKDIESGHAPFDIACMIVNITKDAEDNRILCVWDGTTFRSNSVEIEEEAPTPYLQLIPYPGTILKIRVRQNFLDWDRLQVGTWIRMQRLVTEMKSGKLRCVISKHGHPRSSIFIISENDSSVRSCRSGCTQEDPIQLD